MAEVEYKSQEYDTWPCQNTAHSRTTTATYGDQTTRWTSWHQVTLGILKNPKLIQSPHRGLAPNST